MLTEHVAHSLRASGYRIVITGAGGWLGLATLELLAQALGPEVHSRVHCFGSSRRELSLLSGLVIQQEPLARLRALDPAETLLLHLAFLTKDRVDTMDEAEYRAANRDLSAEVLAHLGAIGTVGVFVASSGAARFADDPMRSAALRLYGELKRDDEVAFARWAEDGGKRAVIARIFNISGPHINKLQSYALSALLLDCLAGRPLTVKASHRVVRGYVAIRELISLVFALLLDPALGVARFDTAGEPMELEDVARNIAAVTGGTVQRASLMDFPDDRYVGNPEPYGRLLDRYAIDRVPFADQVRETRDYVATLAG